ncbi:sulfatase-like hydrolase/transferase [Thermodesulfobacteriota bacterium]
MTSSRPNILLIMSDQHTMRVTGCYGDGIVSTPNLDRLAARGVRFTNAYTPSPLCVPARMSFLTGKHPYRQSCWTNSDILPSDMPTTAHALGAAGYKPILVGRLHSIGVDQMRGYVRREVGDHSTNWVGGVPHSLGVLAKTNDPYRVSIDKSGPGQSAYECHDDDVTESALSVLDELAESRKSGKKEPFAMTVGYLLPHQPYVARKAFYDRYKGKINLPDVGVEDINKVHPYLKEWREFTDTTDLAADDILKARIAYYALVEEMDAMIGRILDKLEKTGLDDNTLVIYCSDHGDQLGERGLWWKQTFYEESVKVPLIMAWPGVLPEGESRNQVVNLVDLAATILEACKAPSLPDSDGRSFLEVAHDPSRPWLNETYSEYCTDGMAPWTGPTPVQQRMIRSGKWKLNYYHGYEPQLFDIEADPQETNDLADDMTYRDIRDGLTAKILTGWDPETIIADLAAKRESKELLKSWSRSVLPRDHHRWQLLENDNWLDEETSP